MRLREVCPDFGGRPQLVRWSIPDPATAGDTGQDSYPVFHRTAAEIGTRIHHLLAVLDSPPDHEAQP
ncbi:MAG TPA: hypothetical protein VNS49_15575 [Streptomyces sp.]|nr:hypothetical protein [Streptomyces sp.]